MKKKYKKEEPEEVRQVNDLPGEDDLHEELNNDISIEEFIKVRKLQNQILEKMLEKLSHPDQKNKTKENK
jgi:hypothetical protein